MKILYIGDMHFRPDSMDQCLKLFDFILKTIEDKKPDKVCFLGDQFDNHGIVYLQIVDKFVEFVKKIPIPSIILVGNHDRSNDYTQRFHSMEFVNSLSECTVVHSHKVIDDILFVSYQHKQNNLIELAHAFKTRYLICHQTFTGSYYDNGFYASDGIDSSLIPQQYIISGHIHAKQKLGKVIYTGSSRWININDVNDVKSVLLVDHDYDYMEEIVITGVPSIKMFDIRSDDDLAIAMRSDFLQDNITFNLIGDKSFISKVNDIVKTMEHKPRIRQFPTQVKQVRVSESSGVKNAFVDFTTKFQPKYGSEINELQSLATKRINWNVK